MPNSLLTSVGSCAVVVACSLSCVQISLQSFVDDSSSQVLNADASTNLKSVLGVGAGILRSDASVDHELIMGQFPA